MFLPACLPLFVALLALPLIRACVLTHRALSITFLSLFLSFTRISIYLCIHTYLRHLQDLALTSPAEYYKEGEGSLLQCVLTPGDKWMPKSLEEISDATLKQVLDLFPSARYVYIDGWMNGWTSCSHS